jgi:hypothetical protein
VAGLWFSLISSINETDRHDITELLLKVALNTITQPTHPILSKQNYLVTSHPKLILSTFIVIEACYSVLMNSNLKLPGLLPVYQRTLVEILYI